MAEVELRQQLGQLSQEEESFCTIHTLRRYLKARNNNVAKAAKLLKDTLVWRREFGVSKLVGDEVMKNGMKGKLFTYGADRQGRPIFFMRPNQEETRDDHDNNIRHLVYQLERVCSYMDEESGIGKMVVVLDCHEYSASNAPPMKTSRETLTILQDYYPERLGKFIVLTAPWYFTLFYKAISPFIDKVTKEKIAFVSGDAASLKRDLETHFDMNQFPDFLHGNLPGKEAFDASMYYKQEGYEKGRMIVHQMRQGTR